ncbi:hypothetical protein LTR84_003074 [Exophiala bonariae]|uniref:acetolactate synthase n=1 Tax=Exophiala bonariae TaxID=1690606 RepID=A0AAV9NA00_9EURO|nr:hypothetical protein LTR84_003074 [Exophiala bonariae]
MAGGEMLRCFAVGAAPGPVLKYPAQFEHKCPKMFIARHEQSTGHMAEGYARATGQPGVVIVGTGSSITNMVTPMQDALCDGTPMVVLCTGLWMSQADSSAQEHTDVLFLTQSCTKWNVEVSAVEDLPTRITQAFQIATHGRPGPVLIYLPRTMKQPSQDSLPTRKLPMNPPLGRSAAGVPKEEDVSEALARVARLVNMAQRPVLYVGQGMLALPEGPSILKDFTDRTSIPVTTSLQGLGAFDEHDPKALHMFGLHGTGYANHAIQKADLILALGARFDDRVTGNVTKFAPQATLAASQGRGGIVQFDIAPKNVNKIVQVTESIYGDCATRLAQLCPLVTPVVSRPAWSQQISEWKQRYPLSAYKKVPTTPEPDLIRTQEVIERLSDMTDSYKDRTLISTGVGQHQMWAAQYFRWRHPRTMITSGGLGTMGYGLPAAIGAKLARPECLVIDIDGDASFNMTMTELSTAARDGIDVKVLLFNNEQMGMVSDLQRVYFGGRLNQNRQKNPDFVRASRALGVQAERCDKREDIDRMLDWLITSKGPAVLEVMTEQNSSVWPIVPAGKALDEFITYLPEN